MRFTPHEYSECTTGVDDEFNKFVDFVTRLSCKCILVREDADEEVKRDHSHLLVYYNKTLSTFRQKFKLKFEGYDGNKDFSMKDASEDGEKPFWYICKGNGLGQMPNVLYKMDYTENDIKVYHEAGWAYVNEMIAKKAVNVTHAKIVKEKKDPDTFVMRCAKDLKERYPQGRYGKWNFAIPSDREKVYDAVMDNLGELGKSLDEFIIYRHMGGVMNQLDRDSAKGVYRKKVLDRFLRDD